MTYLADGEGRFCQNEEGEIVTNEAFKSNQNMNSEQSSNLGRSSFRVSIGSFG